MASQIEEIKSAVDIVQVIGERVNLTKAGKNFKGLCPFHSEKTPSFFATLEIQRYKCFGCGKSGDVLTFVQEYDSLTFVEALEMLAKRAGIMLERQAFSPEDAHRKRLYEVLHLAREYFHYVLTEHKLGEPARKYLKTRGITSETIKTFGLGYAPNSWDGLYNYLVKKKKYDVRELEDVGLVIRKTGTRGTSSGIGAGDVYDRFRGRIMFPLTDAQGKVVGFSGRVLDPEIKEAKYINSPETQLYHKSELLFGYSVLKNFIRKEEEVLVVEGELDALSSYQAGAQNVVAIKGSALTEKQVRLLSRSVKRVILALDADSAGVEATKRAIETARPFELSLRVLPLVGGKDPDVIAREQPKIWRDMVKKTASVYAFLIDSSFTAHGDEGKTGEGKRLITNEVIPVLASIQNSVEQAHFLEYAAEHLDVKQEALEKELEKYLQKRKFSPGFTPRNTPPQENQDIRKNPTVLFTSRTSLERYLCSLLLRLEPADVQKYVVQLLDIGVQEPVIAKLIKHLARFIETQPLDLTKFAQSLPEELRQPLSDLYLEFEDDDSNVIKEFEKARRRHAVLALKERMQEIAHTMAELEQKTLQTAEEEQTFKSLQDELVLVGEKIQVFEGENGPL
ncbi:MAG TPA: DNA primase [Candidatus Pacebacteria bacterium]|nr:MAG: primase protein [Microgenomates group bacterium GW2011_GWB1_45_17]KKU23947.1 MAG: primase protein [Microgenomates group bacterium GW2011_GWA1_46_15]KKU24660.1 MAG: primase protein [Microgenomates group bacterium GW2011_GWC1_46_15]HAV15195.1 DNA primase [Candidatus Paceibacterota bacterium]HCR11094.1 DNA primase [Candidatus Paceibacterota bacterium]